jgi:hypothetical protein
MGTLTRTIALAVGMTVFAGSTALAASQAKTEWKETKKDHKTIAKFVKKYEKAIPKGKDGKYEADIKQWAKDELADLRAMGVKTKEDKAPAPVHPQEQGNQPEPEEKKEGFNDKLVDVLKDIRDKPKAEGRLNAMKQAEQMYAKWEERRKAKI